MDRELDTTEFMERLQVSRNIACKWAQRGQVPARRDAHGAWVFPVGNELKALAESRLKSLTDRAQAYADKAEAVQASLDDWGKW